MCPKTFKIIPLIALALTAAPSFAGGISGTGGGHLINDQLVADYALDDPSELPDFDRVDKYVKIFEDRVPEFGAKLRAIAHPDDDRADSVTWYKIPRRFNELLLQDGGVSFPANQAAYQERDEIYVSTFGISDEALKEDDGSAAKDPSEARAKLYFNEILEMAKDNKDKEAVHKLMIYLKRNHYAPPAAGLQSMLSQLGYGDFLTSVQFKARQARDADVRQVVKGSADKLVSDFLARASEICHSPTERSLPSLQKAFYDLKFRRDVDHKFAELDDAGETVDETVLREEANYCQQWLENEHVDSLIGALGIGSFQDYNASVIMLGNEIHVGGVRAWSMDSCNLSTGINDEKAFPKIDKYKIRYRGSSPEQNIQRVCDDAAALQSKGSQPGPALDRNPETAGSAE